MEVVGSLIKVYFKVGLVVGTVTLGINLASMFILHRKLDYKKHPKCALEGQVAKALIYAATYPVSLPYVLYQDPTQYYVFGSEYDMAGKAKWKEFVKGLNKKN